MPQVLSEGAAAPLLPSYVGASLLRRAVVIGAGVCLLTLAARITVPMVPVPMTLETLAVMVIAALAGCRLGAETVGSFLVLGALGVPVFAGGAGPLYFAGPTGGFLIGFFLAALVIGWLADRGVTRHVVPLAVALLLGDALMFAAGTAWLAFGLHLGFAKALAAGVLPFLLGDAVKIAFGTALVRALSRSVGAPASVR